MRSQIDFAKEISSYHKDRWEHLTASIDKAVKNADEKSIHKLRIAIKKIKSLFQFYKNCNKDIYGKDEIKIIRKLFKKAGEIRDHTNMLQLCDKFKIDAGVLEGHNHILKENKDKLYNLCRKHYHQLKNAGNKNLKHTNVHLWAEYIVNQSVDIKTALSADISAEDYHPLRKKIKALVYNAEISDAEDRITSAELKQLDKLQNKIGEWHDMLMFSRLEEIMEYGIAHQSKFATIIKEEKRLYKQILDQAKEIVKEKKKKSISGSAADLH